VSLLLLRFQFRMGWRVEVLNVELIGLWTALRIPCMWRRRMKFDLRESGRRGRTERGWRTSGRTRRVRT
jgi:hypothetical protein